MPSLKKGLNGILFLLVVNFIFLTPHISAAPERLIELRIFERKDLEKVLKIDPTILDRKGNLITALATDQQILLLRSLGFSVEVLLPDYYKEMEKFLPYYPTFDEVCRTLDSLARIYSHIAKLETLGFSDSGQVILAMKVTDNPSIEEEEPEIRITGTHHGNEKISTTIVLYFLKALLAGYQNNQFIRHLIDSREIFSIPILNGFGYVRNRRTNACGVDLNRDYGYMWDSAGRSPSPFSQIETKAMKKLSEENNFVFSYDYHSVASYVNYLWDFHPSDPPDSSYIIYLSRRYADSTYGSPTTSLRTINGYDWYEVRGSCQDYLFGVFGTLAWTIETQQPTLQARIDSICIANFRAILDMISLAKRGIYGKVIDSLTGEPVKALITFSSPKRWICYNDQILGDFYKPLPQGRYTLKVLAANYEPKIIEDIEVLPDTGTELLIKLTPSSLPLGFGKKVEWVRRTSADEAQTTLTIDALGLPDSIFYSLCFGGRITIEVDKKNPIRNCRGNDFTVYEGDDGIVENFHCYAALNNQDWRYCGLGSGTSSFDLTNCGLDSAYYIKIVDANSGSNTLPYAGFDLDAITYPITLIGIAEENKKEEPKAKILNKIGKAKVIALSKGELKLYNFLGQEIIRQKLKDKECWEVKDLPPGVYFLKFFDAKSQEKFRTKILVIKK